MLEGVQRLLGERTGTHLLLLGTVVSSVRSVKTTCSAQCMSVTWTVNVSA